MRKTRTYLRVRVEHGEVADDDGHGQGDGQHAGQSAQRPHEHADVRLGGHVAVPDGGHRDDGPPQPQRDALELVVRIVLAVVVVVE